MKVESYKKKSGNVYEVVMDDGSTHKIYDDIIIKYELLIDSDITSQKMNEMKNENELLDAYYKALKYINIKMRTKKEIEMYLKKHGFYGFQVEYAIDKLESEGYINQDMYTSAFINDAINLTMDGPKKIHNDLIKLGIGENLIDKYLSKYEKDLWLDRIDSIVSKKEKTNKYGISLFKNKMYTYLVSKGYDGEDIKTILNDRVIETSEVFNKEAQKVWDSLISKYSFKDASLKFRNKMYLKGYSIDDINNYVEKKED